MEIQLLCQFVLLLISANCVSSDERESEENERQVREVTTENTAVATTESFRHSRWYRYGNYAKENERGYHDDDDEHDDHDMDEDMKAMTQPKTDYWGGYYDFLINEGSYKFWAVFQKMHCASASGLFSWIRIAWIHISWFICFTTVVI